MTEHKPRFRYDCENCQFNWCCGHLCECALDLPSVPFIEEQVLFKRQNWAAKQAEIDPDELERELDAIE